jgi:hypothetical protein
MKHLVPALLFALGAGAALGQSDTKHGKRVVDEAIAALGGEKFLSMNDRVESGRAYSFYRERLSGLARATIYTRYAAPAPGKLALDERQAFGKDEDSAVLFQRDGDAFEITFRGARPLAPDRTARYNDSTTHNVLYILRTRLKEPGLIFESRGSDVVDNMPVEIVDIIDSNNETTTVYFHRSTKLPVRQMFYRRDPKTRERHEEVTIFSKYRDVGDGVHWPFAIERSRDGEKIFEMYADTVVINQGLADHLFALPTGMKRLKPSS